MPYRNIMLTSASSNKKIKINPGTIMGMLEHSDYTKIFFMDESKNSRNVYLDVKEKIDDIYKKVKFTKYEPWEENLLRKERIKL